MTITIHDDMIQGSDEWLSIRRGLLTASEMKHIITPTLKVANNDKSRAHVWEIAAQRISEYTEPSYVSNDMLRGVDDEIDARTAYIKNVAMVRTVGFITNDDLGFTIGYSPDGLVGDDGLIEAKGRRQRFQIETIVTGLMPDEFSIQVQSGLLVSKRSWCDFLSYSGGLPMCIIRVEPDPDVQEAITEAATKFEAQVNETVEKYFDALRRMKKVIPTPRRIEQEMYV